MKVLLIIGAVLLVDSIGVKAQSSDAPLIQPVLRSSDATLRHNMKFDLGTVTVVRSQHNEYRVDKDLSFKSIKKEWISAIDILRDSVSVHKYTKLLNNAVVVVTLKDDEYPEAFKVLEKNLIKM
jgi:hypothetical protein